jgi:hypothetical protein
MTYNNNLKKAIYKWRETHQEEYREYMRSTQAEYRANNKDKANASRMKCYYEDRDPYLKQCKTFRRIRIE